MGEDAHGVRLRFGTTALNHRSLRLLGSRLPRLAGGWMPWLEYATYALPARDPAAWVRVRPILSGVCGSDLALLTGRASAILSPFASFPAVLGHEVLARIESGPDAGRRVAVDPLIGCVVRGLTPCRSCADGLPGTCLRQAEGDLAPGPMIGFCADLPGGWSDAMVVHRSQLHVVPDTVTDEEAVLVEPLSVAMHAVLQDAPRADERVLVIGAGTVGLCTLAALRLTDPTMDVTVVARHPAQARLADRMGAARILRERGPALLDAGGAVVGAHAYRSIYGEAVLSGGFDHVYDAVGSQGSLTAAIGLAAPRGRVAVLGGPGHLRDMDWTLVWTRELHVAGTYVYGNEPSLAGAPHTFDHVIELLAARPGLPLGELVTHRFALRDWRRAMSAAISRSRSGALKIVFEPEAGR
jgi:L-iditol 2-dehydrogenase